MQLNEIKKILSIANFKFKKNLIFSLCSSLLEVLSLGSLIPLIIVLVDEKGAVIQKFDKIFPISINESSFLDVYIKLTFIILIFYLLSLILYILLRYLVKLNILRFQAELAYKIFNEYLKRDYQKLVNEKVANVHNIISAETKRFSGGVLNSLFEILSKITVLALICIFIFWYKPILTSIVIIFGIILMGLLFFLFKTRISKFNNTISKKNSQNFDFLSTGLNSFLDLKIFNLSTDFLEKYKQNCLEINNQNLNIEMISLFPKLLIESIIIIVFFIVIAFSNIDIKENLLLISIFVFSFYKIYPYLSQIFNYVVLFKASKSCISQILDSFQNLNINESKNIIKLNINFEKKLELKDINFQYSNNSLDHFKIKNFNFDINYGDIVAIVGPTGSGKTTLINILLGLLKPNSGKILIDNKLLDNSTFENWMQKISYAAINPFFANTSIRKNITFKDEISENDQVKLNKIYKITMLDNFIKNYPEGDLTIISDSNLNLSSGQKQRINIARSLFKDANLIFFDEPTSSLDFETEEKILKELINSGFLKTAIFATHRKEVLKYCNKIIDLNKI